MDMKEEREVSIPREEIRTILVHQDNRISNLEGKFDVFMEKTSGQLEDLSKNLNSYANRPTFDLKSALSVTQSMAILIAAVVAGIVYISSNHISSEFTGTKRDVEYLSKEYKKMERDIEQLKDKTSVLPFLVRPMRPQ